MNEKILVIDDNPDAGQTMVWTLQSMGYDVQLVKDGPAALTKIQKFIPDVVLCDICMPGMLGYEVCKKMKSDYRLKNTLFIAQTGIDSPAGIQRASDSGFAHHMVKPINVQELAKIIKLERSRLPESGTA